MKKLLISFLMSLAFLISGIAQPVPAELSKRLQDIPGFEDLQFSLPPKTIPQNASGNWFEPDTVYMFGIGFPPNAEILIGKHSFSYENGKCIYSILYLEQPMWIIHKKYMHTYDALNNIQETLVQDWKENINNWVNASRTTYSYDAHNNIQETLGQNWNQGTNQWVNGSKTTYSYDAQNNCSEMIFQSWDMGGWNNSAKMSYNYDAQNNKTEALFQIWAEEWINYWRITYSYNSQNNMSEEILQLWGYQGQWEDNQKIIYLYDARNNVIEIQQHDWNPYLEEWAFNNKWIFTYDTKNNRTNELLQSRNQLNEWVNYKNMSYTYDKNNNATAGVFQRWTGNEWVDWQGDLSLHYNNMKSTREYSEISKFSATYINVGSQSIQDHSTESVIKLYPNPVSNILHVETGSNIAPEIKVFSIQGVLLLQTKGNEIDMSSLAKGIYFAEIDGVCRKVVKQ